MKLFVDGAELAAIQRLMDSGLCDGVTTNPTILRKAGVVGLEAMYQRQLEIANLIFPLPLSVEVTSDQPDEIRRQIAVYREKLPQNIMVKITVSDRDGKSLLPSIYEAASSGLAVNVTAMLNFNQCILAAKCLMNGTAAAQVAGIKPPPFNHIVSLFAGRISEEHGSLEAIQILKDLREWLDVHKSPIEIICASVRTPENVSDWAKSGAHILTVPPAVLEKCLYSARSKETVVQFLNDAKEALE